MKKAVTHKGKPCRNGHDGTRYTNSNNCVECQKRSSHYRWQRSEEWKKQRREKYATEGGRADRRERNLIAKYGMTSAQFEERLAGQNYQCAICSVESWAVSMAFHVDHDHATGAVRELLCQQCNVAVGLCGDDPVRMEKAAAYLRKHGKV